MEETRVEAGAVLDELVNSGIIEQGVVQMAANVVALRKQMGDKDRQINDMRQIMEDQQGGAPSQGGRLEE